MLKSIQIYYKGGQPRRGGSNQGGRARGRFSQPPVEHLDIRCRQLPRQRRRKCQRLLRLNPQQPPSRSDDFYLEAPSDLQHTQDQQIKDSDKSLIEPVSSSVSSAPKESEASLETSTEASWPRDIGSHFAQMADAFAQSINNFQIQRVQYSDSCPRVVTAPICERDDPNECWSVGRKDRCKDNAICCFNGCHNVCFDSNAAQKDPVNQGL